MAVFRQGVEREQKGHENDAANEDVEEDSKALVSTVSKKPVPSGSESCQRLAQIAMVVPMAATQPSGRRDHEGGSEASISIMATPVSVRITSGRMR